MMLPNLFTSPKRLLSIAGVFTIAGVLAACGGSTSNGTATSSSGSSSSVSSGGKSGPLASSVPAKYRSRGYLVMATDPTIGAPFASFASGTHNIIGLDVDLAKAIGQELGLTVRVQNVTFDNFIPGLAADRYDFSVSVMLDTTQREKQVNFVDFIKDGSGFLVKHGSSLTNLTLAKLCGMNVSAIQGSVEADDLNTQSKKCQSESKKPINVMVFAQNNQAILAVASGRAAAFDGDSDINAWIRSQPASQVQPSGPAYGVAIDGIAVGKNSGLTTPIQKALKNLMVNGTYQSILKKYGVQQYALASATINNAQLNG